MPAPNTSPDGDNVGTAHQSAYVMNAIGQEVVLAIPSSVSWISSFPAMFEELEKLKGAADGSISSYGLSATTMEEVFLQLVRIKLNEMIQVLTLNNINF